MYPLIEKASTAFGIPTPAEGDLNPKNPKNLGRWPLTYRSKSCMCGAADPSKHGAALWLLGSPHCACKLFCCRNRRADVEKGGTGPPAPPVAVIAEEAA